MFFPEGYRGDIPQFVKLGLLHFSFLLFPTTEEMNSTIRFVFPEQGCPKTTVFPTEENKLFDIPFFITPTAAILKLCNNDSGVNFFGTERNIPVVQLLDLPLYFQTPVIT